MLTLLLTSLLWVLSEGFSFLLELLSKVCRPLSTEVTPRSPAITPTREEYKRHIELYKFGLVFAFKAITIFFLLVSAVLTLGLAPGKEQTASSDIVTSDLVRRMLLITSFLVNIAMIVGFDLATYLWLRLSLLVNGQIAWRGISRKPDITWNELVVRLYSPSLTLMLAITTTLFIIFSFLLSRIMARHHVWF
jgi:hypothetical protein